MNDEELTNTSKSPGSHTEPEPPVPDGPPDGPLQPALGGSAQPEAGGQAEPGNAVPTAASVFSIECSALAPAVQAHLAGEPDSLPMTWCEKCQADVKPQGRGQCPRCGRVLRHSFLARRHPVNKLRRQQLLDKFVRDYRPDTQRLQSMCEQYAGIVEQLEVLKPGSPDHQRLVQLSQLLGAALEESHVPPAARLRRQFGNLSSLMLTELVERTEKLAQDAREMARRAVDELQAAVRGDMPPPDPTPTGNVENGVDLDALPDARQSAAPAPEPEAPLPPCPHCGRTPVRCAELKQNALDQWRVLHGNDPAEVERRDAEATAVMMKMVRHGHGPY